MRQEKDLIILQLLFTISPLKNTAWLNELGTKAGELSGATFLPSDFKKKGGYQRSIQLSKEYDLYRQNSAGAFFQREKVKNACTDKKTQKNNRKYKKVLATTKNI